MNQSDTKTIWIHLATFNVGTAEPAGSVFELFDTGMAKLPDLVVVSLQEIDMSANSLILENTDAKEHWSEFIGESLTAAAIVHGASEADPYVQIGSVQNAGVFIGVWARTYLQEEIQNVASDRLSLGFMGLANKGAVMVSLSLFSSSFVFVGCHLAAHTAEIERRLQDSERLLTELSISRTSSVSSDDVSSDDGQLSVLGHDKVFILGDLNYRVEGLELDEIKTALEGGNFGVLLAKDQLELARQAGGAFPGFSEAEVTFAPTYKYSVNEGRELLLDDPKRLPSYTDRILFQARDARSIRPLRYDSVPSVLLSDHKPVFLLAETAVVLQPDDALI